MPPLSKLTSRATHAHPTSPRSTGFCAIRDCIGLDWTISSSITLNSDPPPYAISQYFRARVATPLHLHLRRSGQGIPAHSFGSRARLFWIRSLRIKMRWASWSAGRLAAVGAALWGWPAMASLMGDFDKCDACGVVGQELLAALDTEVLSKATVSESGRTQVELSADRLLSIMEGVCDRMQVHLCGYARRFAAHLTRLLADSPACRNHWRAPWYI